MSVGIVGLGTGSLACYAKAGDNFRFYEIDPVVVKAATDPKLFDFLSLGQRNTGAMPDAHAWLTGESFAQTAEEA